MEEKSATEFKCCECGVTLQKHELPTCDCCETCSKQLTPEDYICEACFKAEQKEAEETQSVTTTIASESLPKFASSKRSDVEAKAKPMTPEDRHAVLEKRLAALDSSFASLEIQQHSFDTAVKRQKEWIKWELEDLRQEQITIKWTGAFAFLFMGFCVGVALNK